jgi:hypothetical protein
MTKKTKGPTPFEFAYFVEHNMRSKHEDDVEHGPSKHVVKDNWSGFQEWLSDPSRRDFPYVDTQKRKDPPKNYKKHVPIIKHMLHKNFDGLLHDTYWDGHPHPNEDNW